MPMLKKLLQKSATTFTLITLTDLLIYKNENN